jgi:predicted TIM-barrel fold metal-dependent hydrolase
MDAAGIAHTILVGSPKETLVGKGGFVDYDENNARILTIQTTYPNRFSAFVTINPRDPDKLRKLDGYLRAGAKGLKLYSGHSNFYDLPLTDASMEPLYAYLERRRLPVLWHVNLAKFGGEFEAVLARHPRLLVILPHLGLSSIKLERLESLLDRYPNLSTDLSFGYDPFLITALKRISRHPSKYRDFISRHRDRILFGTDMVVTKHKRKTTDWLADVMRCYRQMLEAQQYRCALVTEELNGLGLDPETLRQIYEGNPRRNLSLEANR